MSIAKNSIKKNNAIYHLPENISSLNFRNINNDNYNNKIQDKKVGWWINELHSLGIKKINYDKSELKYIQNLEALSDKIKQQFIRKYIS